MIRLRAPLFLLVAFVFPESTMAADEGPAKDVPELQILNNYLGEWDVEVTSKNALFAVGQCVGQASATWTLDGRFLQQTSSLAPANDSKLWKTTILMTYDEKRKTYRMWRFLSSGHVTEAIGSWDSKTRTMTSTYEDGDLTVTFTSQFSENGIEQWSLVMTDKKGSVFGRITGKNTRRDSKTAVSSAQLDTFMKKWSEYRAFQVPMDPKEEPLLQAALKKSPKGPWAAYLSMKFAQTTLKARNLSNVDRAALYSASLRYLKPARDILALSVKADPDDKKLQHSLNQMGQHVALASLEAGLDFVAVKSFAEATLAKNKDAKSWNYGNMILNGHTLLGRIALREGKLDEAKQHLLAAGHTPGSPQLNSFGPGFILARELAEKGERDTVIAFLELVAHFWANPDERTEANSKRVASENLKQLESWKTQLRTGKVPDHPKWW